MTWRHRVRLRILPGLLMAALLFTGCSAGGPDPSAGAPPAQDGNAGQAGDDNQE